MRSLRIKSFPLPVMSFFSLDPDFLPGRKTLLFGLDQKVVVLKLTRCQKPSPWSQDGRVVVKKMKMASVGFSFFQPNVSAVSFF